MSKATTSARLTQREWTVESIRALVQDKFKKRPCIFQIKVAQAIYKGKDVIACAPTGAGKTLSFWISLLMAMADSRENLITFVVTLLNVLGKQNETQLIPFYVASATLPPPVLRDVKNILRIRVDETDEILRSNDQPDIHLMVRVLEHPSSSFEDLAFLIPEDISRGESEPKKFLVFFDNTKEAEAACLWLRNRDRARSIFCSVEAISYRFCL